MNLNVPFGWRRLTCPECAGLGYKGFDPSYTRHQTSPSAITESISISYARTEPCLECGGSKTKWAYGPIDELYGE